MLAGTVSKLLRKLERETKIRVDEVNVRFPITSADSVSEPSPSPCSSHKRKGFLPSKGNYSFIHSECIHGSFYNILSYFRSLNW